MRYVAFARRLAWRCSPRHLTSTIAAATVTFSVVDALVLRPLRFERPNELVAIGHQRGDRVMSQARLLIGATRVTVSCRRWSRYVALELAVGLPIAWLATRTSATLFFQARPTDAWGTWSLQSPSEASD
jgi:hypothetical protein